mmetsp:Transcript_48538/g.90061  ORF Transcript_48538/g.90061 Transcript_48538/m.90061 type:complete len:517 (-) Transcript_48538:146-1696(-)
MNEANTSRQIIVSSYPVSHNLLLNILLEEYSSVVATKTQIGTHCSSNLHFPLLVWHIIQIALRIGSGIVDSRRNNTVRDAPRCNHSLKSPRRSKSVPRNALGAGNDELPVLRRGVVSEHGLDRHGLELVVVVGGRPVRVQVADLLLLHPAHLHGHLHRLGQTAALRRGRGDVMRVARRTVSHHLAVNLGPSLLGRLQALEQDDARSFAHDKPTPVRVERTRPGRRVVVVLRRHGLHGAEAGVAKGRDRRLGPPRDHHVGVAVHDHPHGLPDGVTRRRARRRDAIVGTPRPRLDADDAARRVPQQGRDGEGRHLRPFRLLGQLERLLLERLHPPEGRPDEHSAPLGRLFAHRVGRVSDAAVLQGLPRRRHGEVRVPVVRLGVLKVHEVILRIEHVVGHFRTDLTGIVRYVEPLDLPEARLALHAGVEEVFVADAAPADHAEAGHYHSLAVRLGRHSEGRRRRRRGPGAKRRPERERADALSAQDDADQHRRRRYVKPHVSTFRFLCASRRYRFYPLV